MKRGLLQLILIEKIKKRMMQAAPAAIPAIGLYKAAPKIGRALQKAPEFKIPRQKLIPPLRALAGVAEFGPQMVGGAIRSYGRTLERVATPTGRKELKKSLFRVVKKPLRWETLREPAFEAALDIPDFFPGGFLFAGGLKMVGKGAGKKFVKEAGEKFVKETGEKFIKETGEKGIKEIAEKGVKKKITKKVAKFKIKTPEVKIKRPAYLGEIGELERKVDDLIGYTPGGIRSKDDAMREQLLQYTKEAAPPKVVKVIEKLENTLSELRNARLEWEGVEKGLKKYPQKLLQKEASKRAAIGRMSSEIKEMGEKLKKLEVEKVKVKGKVIQKSVHVFNINLDRLKTTKSGKKIIYETVEKLKPELSKIKGKTLGHKEVLKEAQRSQLLQGISPREHQKTAEATLLATRQRLTALSNEIAGLGGKATKTTWNEYVRLLKTVSSYAAEKGRALEALKIGAKGRTVRDEFIKEILKTGAKTDAIVVAARGVDFDNAKQVTEFYRKFVKPNASEILNWYRYVNMLSSPKTQVINILGNLFQAPLAVSEKLVSGTVDAVSSVLTGKTRQYYVEEVPHYVRGFVNAVPEAISNFRKALSGETVIKRPDVKRMPFTTKGLGWTYGSILRMMEGADVFFQTLFKAATKESLAYKYAKMGKKIAPEVLEGLVEKEALYRIFRQPLNAPEQGYVLKWIDQLTSGIYSLRRVPGLGWIAPFVQTPMNILKQGLEHSPMGIATIPGAAEKTPQVSKALIGSMVSLGAAFMALENRTTWKAPIGKKQKELFYATFQPYSLRIGDKWISYSKLGPIAYPIALSAAFKYEFERNPSDKVLENMGRAVLAMSDFFTDQSYLQGIGNAIDAVRGEEYAAKRLISGLGRQVIPLVSLQGWVARIVDDVYRHPESIAEHIKVGVPIVSKGVAPYRTPTGEPSKRQFIIFNAISPFQIRKHDPVYAQIYRAYQVLLRVKKVRSDLFKIAKDLDLTDEEKRKRILEKINRYRGKEARFLETQLKEREKELKPAYKIKPTQSPAGKAPAFRVKVKGVRKPTLKMPKFKVRKFVKPTKKYIIKPLSMGEVKIPLTAMPNI